MSSDAVSWAFEQDVSAGKLVLVAIAEHANPSGVCFPGHQRLAIMCNLNAATISRAVKRLEEERWLGRAERKRGNGSRTSDWLVLGPHRPPELRRPMREPADQEHYPEEVMALFETHCILQGETHCIFDEHTLQDGGDQNRHLTESQQTPSVSSPVDLVFREWVAATHRDPARTHFTEDRRRRISRALASHGLDDCLAAVRNIGRDAWARGQNDRGRRFDDIEHALGTTKRLEHWREAADELLDEHEALRARGAEALQDLMGRAA